MARMQLTTGTEIDGFLIGEKLHQGGMAEIWHVTKEGIDMLILSRRMALASMSTRWSRRRDAR